MDDPDDQFLPAYRQVVTKIHQRLSRMKVGDQLSPERLLSAELGVSRGTLRRGLAYFHRQGILGGRGQRGTRLMQDVSPLPKSQKTSRLIGLVIPSIQFDNIARIVMGAEQCASERGYHLVTAHDHNDMDYQNKQLRRISESGAEGIAVYPDAKNIQRKEFISIILSIQKRGIPLVLVDRYIPDVSIPAVLSDNFKGMYIATQHLIRGGYRRIGLLSFGPEGTVGTESRRRGFIAALDDYQLDTKSFFEANAGTIGNEISAQKIIANCIATSKDRLPFDALACMQTFMAYGAFVALRDAGLQVPQDMGLIGYDRLDGTLASSIGLNLTFIEQPLEQIGYESVSLLIDEIEGLKKKKAASHLFLEPRLIVGTSCRKQVEAPAEAPTTALGDANG